MRALKYFLLFTGILLFSCDEVDFLKEKPLDFYTTENAYVTLAQFNSAVNMLYSQVRDEFFSSDEKRPFDFQYGTDLSHNGEYAPDQHFTNYIIQLDPTALAPSHHWNRLYKIIANANVILNRIGSSELTDENKRKIEGQALFFRALAYRTLAYLYGGVPIELNEALSPRTDYERATREKVYEQVINDLKNASENLPNISNAKDGEVSNLAAQHLLSEVYLANGEFNNAITAASVVINDPNMSLMTERFGSRKTEPGDVYWDLFRQNNQNRSSGNREAILVMQFELDVNGGRMSSTSRIGYALERVHPPFLVYAKMQDDATTTAGFLWPTSDYNGGRGIGWMVPTYHFSNTIWESDFNNDIRNSEYNFVRKFKFNNPNKPELLGVEFDAETNAEAKASLEATGMWPRNIYPYQTKATTPGHHPDNLFQDKSTLLLKGIAGITYRDVYLFRLAETYLIRAEAYLGAGDKEKAAIDINIVRARANASPVIPANVDINYILDERMRELGVEEKRRLTLARLNLVYERTKAYNFYHDAGGIQEYHNLFPIPYGEIERNRTGNIEQNPGYN